MKFFICISISILFFILALKGQRHTFAFTFDWEGKNPDIKLSHGKGFSAVWNNDSSRDALFRAMIDRYKKEELGNK